jgi:hypothetical protein
MIEGIEIFERIKVYGKRIPSDITILLVLHELKTSEKRSKFIDASNAIVRENLHLIMMMSNPPSWHEWA